MWKVAADNWHFVDQDERALFIPFGVNYAPPHLGWPPQVWACFNRDAVERDFELLAGLGANTVRVFLASGSFQPSADAVVEAALAKLDLMLDSAVRHGLHLILTGPDAWEGRPPYWEPDRFAGEDALRALDVFWDAVGVRYGNQAAIFAWSLVNEPMIPWHGPLRQEQWNAWLKTEYPSVSALACAWEMSAAEIAGRWDRGDLPVPANAGLPGSRRLYDYQRFREHLARSWTERQVRALRATGARQLITNGYIQWVFPLVRAGWAGEDGEPGAPGWYAGSYPRNDADLLDYISVHFYPLLPAPDDEWFELNLRYLHAVLRYCDVGLPVVLEEFGWYGGGAVQDMPYRDDEFCAEWNRRVVESTRGQAAGWLAWPYADVPAATDCSKFGGLIDAGGRLKPWGREFRRMAAGLDAPAPAVRGGIALDRMAALTAADPRPLLAVFLQGHE